MHLLVPVEQPQRCSSLSKHGCVRVFFFFVCEFCLCVLRECVCFCVFELASGMKQTNQNKQTKTNKPKQQKKKWITRKKNRSHTHAQPWVSCVKYFAHALPIKPPPTTTTSYTWSWLSSTFLLLLICVLLVLLLLLFFWFVFVRTRKRGGLGEFPLLESLLQAIHKEVLCSFAFHNHRHTPCSSSQVGPCKA